MKILTVSDSDSYLKWITALCEDVPAGWRVRHRVLDNVIAPSPGQIAAVSTGWPLARRTALGLASEIRRERPDVVALACTGPALEAAFEVLSATRALAYRPVLITGLPGISYPANDLALEHRRACDLMVLHSRREVAAYAAVRERRGSGPDLALATLPFLAEARRGPARGAGTDVVFAAQSLVPAGADDRWRILAALAALPPGLDPVVKVRALAGERQAHNEAHPYADLWAAMDQPRPIAFRGGAMTDALAGAAGFVTVSSTAVLEAVAAGVPSLVLGDFGISAEAITLVFEGSGLIGSLDDLRAGRFGRPREDWARDNYFHDPAEDDWRDRLTALVARRQALAPVVFRPMGSLAARARRLARLTPPGVTRSATSAAAALRRSR